VLINRKVRKEKTRKKRKDMLKLTLRSLRKALRIFAVKKAQTKKTS
jgi:hypothetical protein